MMKNNLISVIMATYQGDNFEHLKIAIKSILSQNYPSIEMIIVCDGPIDAERKEYLTLLPENIFTIHLPKNCGPSIARNSGIDAANGEFIAIMDADDVSEPTRLTDQLDFLKRNDLDLVSSNLLIIDSNGDVSGIRKVPCLHTEIKRLAPLRCPMHNPSAFGKASFFKTLKYNNHLRVSEDYDLWIRGLNNGYLLGNIQNPLVKYRQSTNAIKKRVGYKYAKTDFLVKLKSLKLCPIYLRPIYFCAAFFASAIRLMPPSIFSIIYHFRKESIK